MSLCILALINPTNESSCVKKIATVFKGISPTFLILKLADELIFTTEGLDLFMLLITDIVNSNSQVIALGKSASLVEKAYGVKLENNTALLKGVVSRKKQVVPVMTENA